MAGSASVGLALLKKLVELSVTFPVIKRFGYLQMSHWKIAVY